MRQRILGSIGVCVALGLGAAGCAKKDEAAPGPASDTSTTGDGAVATDTASPPDVAKTDTPVPGDTATDTAGPKKCEPDEPRGLEDQLAHHPTGKDGCHWTVKPGKHDHAAIQTALVEAVPGEVICLAEGTFKPIYEVVIKTPKVTLKGAGQMREMGAAKNSTGPKTILDFTDQISGAQSISVWTDDVLIRDLDVYQPSGDGVKATAVKNIAFLNVSVRWKDVSTANGAYAIYPIQSDGVRVERCYVYGARDAGIYVGQSKNILVIDNETEGNVASLEIENSSDAEVAYNHAHDNTGGILIFNLPNLPVKEGKRTLAHHNLIENNNLPTFAVPGSSVSRVPPGSGLVMLATDDAEVRHNTITNHKSLGIVVLAYDKGIFGEYNDPGLDIYPEGNWVHDNVLIGNGKEPQGLLQALGFPSPIPELSSGGCIDATKPAATAAERKNCWSNNGSAEGKNDATYLDFKQCENLDKTKWSNDLSAVTCEWPKEKVLAPRDPCTGYANGVPTDVGGKKRCTPGVWPVTPKAVKTTCDIPYVTLSEYGLFEGPLADMKPAKNVHFYDVTSPLWSDGADKFRYIALPEGGKVTFDAEGDWTFPKGTILVKTFAFHTDPADTKSPLRVIETRLLLLTDSGWQSYVYVWNDAQTEATRVEPGGETNIKVLGDDGKPADRKYLIPGVFQCHNCHSRDDKVVPLGTTARQLHRPVGTEGQLQALAARGLFDKALPALDGIKTLVNPEDETKGIEARAKSFLDANCAHCHRTGGAASGTGLWLTASETDKVKSGICKEPVAAGPGAGDLYYDIVPGEPDKSIMVFRMSSTVSSIKMPELPNLAISKVGLDVVKQWIAGMTPKGCN